jgi:type IV pilus assembly protein PilZ
MFVVTETPLPFATEIVIHVTLPGQKSAFALPAVVRWVGDGGMGTQFGLIGARETHAITQVVKGT